MCSPYGSVSFDVLDFLVNQRRSWMLGEGDTSSLEQCDRVASESDKNQHQIMAIERDQVLGKSDEPTGDRGKAIALPRGCRDSGHRHRPR